MIRGEVTPDREAVVFLHVRNEAGLEVEIQAVIDTGFTEFISLPPEVVDYLSLPFKYAVPMYLAGEVHASFDAHTGWVEWDGTWREVEVIRAEGTPLVGMSILKGFRLTLDGIDGGPVTILPL